LLRRLGFRASNEHRLLRLTRIGPHEQRPLPLTEI
jgi:hypothetical protein